MESPQHSLPVKVYVYDFHKLFDDGLMYNPMVGTGSNKIIPIRTESDPQYWILKDTNKSLKPTVLSNFEQHLQKIKQLTRKMKQDTN